MTGMDYLFVRRVLLVEMVLVDFVRWEDAGAAPREVGGTTPEAYSTSALRTQTTEGNPSSIFSHVRPSSREPKSWPLLVPKKIPAGSNESAVMASLRTVSYARFCGRPRMRGSPQDPLLRVL